MENDSKTSESNESVAAKQFFIRLGVLFLAGVWAYWTVLEILYQNWNNRPEYSHGYLVPLFSIALLWTRRDKIEFNEFRPEAWGLGLIALAVLIRLAAAYYFFEWFDLLSIIPFVSGIFLLAGGWSAIRWAWPALLFLAFMLPLPHSVQIALRDPLRSIGTIVSTYVMQTFGLSAFSEGNVIIVDEARIGVTEACSGISMLMVFFAFSTAMALFIRERPIWEKILVVASAVPIAIIANVTRITLTGLLHALGYSDFADAFFHDFAGWMMIPLAFAILWVELWLASRIVIVEDCSPMALGLARPTV